MSARLCAAVVLSLAGLAGHARADAYPAERLPVLSRVLVSVNDNYVEPDRIDPRRMVVSALVSIEKTVPEVVVRGDAASPALALLVGSSTHELDLSRVDTIWKVRTALGEALEFVRAHLVSERDPKAIELAAVHGLLTTLDPHTTLIEPAHFRELRTQSGRGGLAGIGLVLAVRDGNLTIVRVLKDAPARRAGLRPKDVITEIDGRSTANIDLQEAVDLLRGKPQSTLSLTVVRASSPAPTRLELTREAVRVESIGPSAVLAGGIGYVRVWQLSAGAATDLAAAITALTREAGGTLNGLVLDLRGNSGGLLEEACRIADLFLSRGVIVTTVGSGRKQRIHEVKEASADPTDVAGVPLVVLVNARTASGAEIVASALRDNGRAVLVGRRTFGQDSIQVLHSFEVPGTPQEQAALKLTIARFSTPGATSVQATGLAPDVLLRPGRILKEQVSWFAPPRAPGEASLPAHFENPATPAERAPLELRYLLDPRDEGGATAGPRGRAGPAGIPGPEQQEDEDADADPERVVEDQPIRFGRELLARAPVLDRAKLIDAARALVAARIEGERARVEARLRELGVDWTAPAAAAGTPRAAVTIAPSPDGDVAAGSTVAWTVTVENQGTAPLQGLRAWTRSDRAPLLDGRELVFGRIQPGQRRSWTVPIAIPREADSRRDEVTIHFEDDGGHAPPDVATTFAVVEAPRAVTLADRPGRRAAAKQDAATRRAEPRRESARITLVPDPASGAPTVKGDTFHLAGVASLPPGDGPRLRDVVVLVGDRKVLFQPAPPDASAVEFQVDLPLERGSNAVTVIVRAGDEQARRSFGVFRRPPAQAAAAPPP